MDDGTTQYGFVWGLLDVVRLSEWEGRGKVIGITAGTRRFQLYVSEAGRSVRMWENNREIDLASTKPNTKRDRGNDAQD